MMGSNGANNTYSGNGKYVPPCHTQEDWFQWIKQNPRDLRKLPENLHNEDFFLLIASQNGFAIGNIPYRYLSPKILITAIKRDPLALNNIPDELKSPLLCDIAVQNDIRAIRCIPESMLLDFASKILAVDGLQCRFIVDKLPQDLLELAVNTTPSAIQFIPIDYLTEKMILGALKKDGEVLQYIPERLVTDEFISIALESDRFGWVFECIPANKKNKYIKFKRKINLNTRI